MPVVGCWIEDVCEANERRRMVPGGDLFFLGKKAYKRVIGDF